MPKGDGYGGRKAQAWVRLVLARYGQVCHLCQHPDADSADHLRPRATHPDLMYSVTNGRPVHHKPCPVCGVRCNIKRKAKPMRTATPIDALQFFDSH